MGAVAWQAKLQGGCRHHLFLVLDYIEQSKTRNHGICFFSSCGLFLKSFSLGINRLKEITDKVFSQSTMSNTPQFPVFIFTLI